MTKGYEPLLEATNLAPTAEEDLSPQDLVEVEQRAADTGAPSSVEVHEDAWTEELVRRARDLRAGRTKSIPAADALAHARAQLRRVRG